MSSEAKSYKVDKSKFGPGPWHKEPDRLEWVDKKTGYPCLIVRSDLGALCGYVGVPESHPFYGVHYDEVPADAHGGLTYSANCREDGIICHTTEYGDDLRWWLGFDCAHYLDLIPSMEGLGHVLGPYLAGTRRSYRNINYVKKSVLSLAKQLKDLADERNHRDTQRGASL